MPGWWLEMESREMGVGWRILGGVGSGWGGGG